MAAKGTNAKNGDKSELDKEIVTDDSKLGARGSGNFKKTKLWR